MQQCRVVCDDKCPVELYGETHSADLRLFATVGVVTLQILCFFRYLQQLPR